MKKCLTCSQTINELSHYACNNCYQEIRSIKKEYAEIDNVTLKTEFNRWKRNSFLSRDTNYSNKYLQKAIAIAELYRDKYRDDSLIKKIIDMSNKTVVETKQTKISELTLEKEFESENKDEKVDIENYISRYKCKDGHRTISKSEREIDNFLTDNNIRHAYDTEIDGNTNFRTDFKLLDYENVFIEHWGYKDRKTYSARKEIKTQYYNANNYILIDSDEDTIQDLNNLKNAIRKAIPNIKFK